jgi:hypothetical protein
LSKIYCSIDNCNYWNQGNLCKASEIMVTADSYAKKAPDNMDAPKHNEFPQFQASTCMETCCKTFVESGSTKVGVDGVTRS